MCCCGKTGGRVDFFQLFRGLKQRGLKVRDNGVRFTFLKARMSRLFAGPGGKGVREHFRLDKGTEEIKRAQFPPAPFR